MSLCVHYPVADADSATVPTQPKGEEGREKIEEGRGKMDREKGRGKRDTSRGKREEGREKKEASREKREEGRGREKRETACCLLQLFNNLAINSRIIKQLIL